MFTHDNIIEYFTTHCGSCRGPVVTRWSKEGLEKGDYVLMGEVFFHKGKCTQEYLDRFTLGHKGPIKERTMNDTPNTNNVNDNGIEVVRHFYTDADGNEIEIPFDLSEGEATPAETAFVAEDAADHAVTLH